jgi:hypothetical protein
MDPNDPTTPADNPADDPSNGNGADPAGTGDGTGANANNPTEPSKSDDANAAAGGDDKSKPKAGESDADKDTPAPFDTDLDDWIEKKGLAKPENDEQKRAYQDFRNSQREFTRAQQAKKDSDGLHDAVKGAKDDLKPKDGDDDDDERTDEQKRLDALEADRNNERTMRLQSEFYTENKVSSDEHKTILEVLKEKIDKAPTNAAKLKALDYWGSPEALPDLLDIAKARLAKATDTSDVADKAAQEERARIARESNAHSPSRSAKNNNPSDKTPEQERTERLKARYSS